MPLEKAECEKTINYMLIILYYIFSISTIRIHKKFQINIEANF